MIRAKGVGAPAFLHKWLRNKRLSGCYNFSIGLPAYGKGSEFAVNPLF